MRGPVTRSERLESLDVLRGFAVLGILIMNIQAFANIDVGYSNPTLSGSFDGADYWAWFFSHVLADTKFMTIFSALFGAGVLLMTSRRESAGDAAAGVHYRRMAYLILIGLLHAYLLWWGDILVWYGLCGLWLYPFRKRRTGVLVFWGLLFVAIAGAVMLLFGWSMQFWPPEQVAGFIEQSWRPTPEALQKNVDAYLGPYWGQVAYRAPKVVLFQTFIFAAFGVWRVGGVMLLGMAALRLGVLSAGRSRRFYAIMIVLGVVVGVPAAVVGVVQNVAHDWRAEYSFFYGGQYNYWASLLVAGGWIGVVMLVFKTGRLGGATRALAATGRMAFSNYIGQTVICTAIFYGWGLGLFSRVDRIGQLLIVLAVWAFQMAVSSLWLRYFRFGPLEWLWRSLSYNRLQPLRVDTVAYQNLPSEAE